MLFPTSPGDFLGAFHVHPQTKRPIENFPSRLAAKIEFWDWQFFYKQNTRWLFNLMRLPLFGSLWKRLVRYSDSTPSALQRRLDWRRVHRSSMWCTECNEQQSRPLTAVHSYSRNMEPYTPFTSSCTAQTATFFLVHRFRFQREYQSSGILHSN